MTISSLSSDTTISQAKLYLDEVKKIAGEASSTPIITTAATSAVPDSKGTVQTGHSSAAGSESDSYNVYIKSDLSNVAGYVPGSMLTVQTAFSTQTSGQLSAQPADSGNTNTVSASGSSGSAPSTTSRSGSSNSAQGAAPEQTSNSQTEGSQTASSTQKTEATQDTAATQDDNSDDMQAYSVLVNDLNMLASLIQSGDMPNAKTTAGTVMKDLNNYLSAPPQNKTSAIPPAPKFVAQNFGSLLASFQEGDKTSASTIINAIKVLG